MFFPQLIRFLHIPMLASAIRSVRKTNIFIRCLIYWDFTQRNRKTFVSPRFATFAQAFMQSVSCKKTTIMLSPLSWFPIFIGLRTFGVPNTQRSNTSRISIEENSALFNKFNICNPIEMSNDCWFQATIITDNCIAAQWSEWGSWSECSDTCGACGTRQRFRGCLQIGNGCNCPGLVAYTIRGYAVEFRRLSRDS